MMRAAISISPSVAWRAASRPSIPTPMQTMPTGAVATAGTVATATGVTAGVAEADMDKALLALDKRPKVSDEDFRKMLQDVGLDGPSIEELVTFLDVPPEQAMVFAVQESPVYLMGAFDAAAAALDFLHQTMLRDGRLLASYKDGEAKFAAYLDDHAFLLDALLGRLGALQAGGSVGAWGLLILGVGLLLMQMRWDRPPAVERAERGGDQLAGGGEQDRGVEQSGRHLGGLARPDGTEVKLGELARIGKGMYVPPGNLMQLVDHYRKHIDPMEKSSTRRAKVKYPYNRYQLFGDRGFGVTINRAAVAVKQLMYEPLAAARQVMIIWAGVRRTLRFFFSSGAPTIARNLIEDNDIVAEHPDVAASLNNLDRQSVV